MTKLLIIPEDQLRATLDKAVRQIVAEVLGVATTIDVPIPGAEASGDNASEGVSKKHPHTGIAPKVQVGVPHAAGQTYVIGTREGEWSYADVVAREFPKPAFAFDEAWKSIKDRIITSSSRARGSARRSLDQDERFERMSPPSGEGGIWYRRTDLEQLRLEGD